MNHHDALHSIVVGGTSGIGAAVAAVLAERGGPVVVVGRDVARTDVLRERYPAVEAVRADLSLVAEIDALAHRLAEGPPLGRLVFTAGTLANRTWATPEGNEANYVVNHVARQRLTDAWLPRLAEADGAAVGYVSAWGDYKRPLDGYDALNEPGGGVRASMRTFLPNDVYFASVAAAHPGLRVVAFNPGPTRGTRLGERAHAPAVLRVLQRVAFPFIASDVDETAARFVRHLDGAETGLHFFKGGGEVAAPAFVREQEHWTAAAQAAAAVHA